MRRTSPAPSSGSGWGSSPPSTRASTWMRRQSNTFPGISNNFPSKFTTTPTPLQQTIHWLNCLALDYIYLEINIYLRRNLGTIAVCLFRQLDSRKVSFSVFKKIPVQVKDVNIKVSNSGIWKGVYKTEPGAFLYFLNFDGKYWITPNVSIVQISCFSFSTVFKSFTDIYFLNRFRPSRQAWLSVHWCWGSQQWRWR